MAADIARVGRTLEAMADTLAAREQERRMTKAGVRLKRAGVNAIRLGGDRGFSGWRRGAPIQLDIAFKVHRDGAGLTMHRSGKSAGPFKVAEDGRNRGASKGFAGPGVNRRTGVTARTKAGGVRKVRATQGRRWNGYTAGRGTWTASQAAMRSLAGRTLEAEYTSDMRAAHRRG